MSSRPCLPCGRRLYKQQGSFAPRALPRLNATTNPSVTLSPSIDFPVEPVIRSTLLRRFRAGTRRASPVARHVLATVLCFSTTFAPGCSVTTCSGCSARSQRDRNWWQPDRSGETPGHLFTLVPSRGRRRGLRTPAHQLQNTEPSHAACDRVTHTRAFLKPCGGRRDGFPEWGIQVSRFSVRTEKTDESIPRVRETRTYLVSQPSPPRGLRRVACGTVPRSRLSHATVSPGVSLCQVTECLGLASFGGACVHGLQSKMVTCRWLSLCFLCLPMLLTPLAPPREHNACPRDPLSSWCCYSASLNAVTRCAGTMGPRVFNHVTAKLACETR